MMRLHGICERAASPEQPLGPDVVVPERVPLTVNFNPQQAIGTATLTRAPNGDIIASAQVSGDGVIAALIRKRMVPYFSIAVTRPRLEKDAGHLTGRVTAGEVRQVAITESNIDPDLPPYEVTDDAAQASQENCGG